MDFTLNEEQQMLADSVGRFADRNDGVAARRQLSAGKIAELPDHWAAFTELGLTGLIVPEVHGGMGGGPVDTLIVMEQLGQRLLGEPFLSNAVLGTALIAYAGSEAQRAELLPRLAQGQLRVALASAEPDSGFDMACVRTRADKEDDGWVLNGVKSVVLHAHVADLLIVTARTSSDAQLRSQEGISLFLVRPDAVGVAMRHHPTIDAQCAAEIIFNNTRAGTADVLGGIGQGFAPLEHAVDTAIAAACAEAVGLMSTLIDMTNAFLGTRKQFGQEIGRFQALQHRAADLQIALEQTRSAAAMAAAGLLGENHLIRRCAISAAKTLVGRYARLVSHQAVQLHGAIGTTDELAVGHYYKRLHSIDMSWGTSHHHLSEYSALMAS